MYRLDDYHYELPPDRIAQAPVDRRDRSRLLVLQRRDAALAHLRFDQIGAYFNPGDVLVVNDTQVVCGRLYGRKPTGGRVELLLLDYAECLQRQAEGAGLVGRCLLRAAKPTRPGTRLTFDGGLTAEVLTADGGIHSVRFEGAGDFEALIERIGHIPLPPYIRRDPQARDTETDRRSYQTVYAARKGAVAAPTAGLHFTEALLAELRSKGVVIAPITLHVGYGTFLPVRVDDIREHRMHAESFEISEASARAIDAARSAGGRVFATGTTCVRTLEYAAGEGRRIRPGKGRCDLFIYPGYRFKAVDAMITNFHLPRSTLLMLVSAFAGRERILAAYQAAVEGGYRFFSYGDGMLIL